MGTARLNWHKKILLILILLLSVLFFVVLAMSPEKSSIKVSAWYSSSWMYRRPVTVANTTGATILSADVLVSIDTSSLISSSKLQADCDDLRFTDSDDATLLSYWVEGGCNTSDTQVWIRIPSLPNGGKTIYLYYSNPDAVNGELTWGGNLYLYTDSSCPTGWTRLSAADNRMLYGSTVAGNTGGVLTHTHTDPSCASSSISTAVVGGVASGGNNSSTSTHTHTGLSTSLNNGNNVPPYQGLVLCYKKDFTIPVGMISMFSQSVSADYTRYVSLDNKFVMSSATAGLTGGGGTHNHAMVTGGITSNASGSSGNGGVTATGGTSTYTFGNYRVHIFNSNGTLTVTTGGPVDALLIAGGGGGGGGLNGANDSTGGSGGGGGGGTVWTQNQIVGVGSLSAVVGAGGIGGSLSPANNGGNGGNTSLTGFTTAIGGGGGSKAGGYSGSVYVYPTTGNSGGCGGGGGSDWWPTTTQGGVGSQGGNGGPSNNPTYKGGGGGGGNASATGYNGANGRDFSSYFGTTVGQNGYFAGGGGGGGGGAGGLGGGGASTIAGTANTGGGGGGIYQGGQGPGKPGGSGIILVRYPIVGVDGTGTPSTHTHTVSSVSTNAVSNIPPYLEVVFGKSNQNTYVDSSNIVIASELPPLGYSRFTALDNRFAMGSTAYGATGGNSSHSHSATLTTGAPSATLGIFGTTGANFADSTHTHSCSTTTDSQSNIPPYYSVIYAQRKASVLTTLQAEQMYNQAPDAPTSLRTEGVVNPNQVTSLTPKFSAVFTDPDPLDTANYYQIQVNTSSDFTGTVMWDSTKTSMTPVTNASRTSDISYAGSSLSLNGVTYYWRIRLYDQSSGESPWSSVASFRMLNRPNTPTNIQGSALSTTSIRWSFDDNSSNEDGVKIYDGNDVLLTTCVGGNLTYCDLTGLSENTQYGVKISAYNSEAESDLSTLASRYTLVSPPNTPVLVNKTTTSIEVSTEVLTGTVEYYFECQTSCGGLTVNSWISTPSVSTINLTSYTQYVFRVKARNGDLVETAYSSALSTYTQSIDLLLTARTLSTSSIELNSNLNGNLDGTKFQILDEVSNMYVQADGTLSSTPTLLTSTGQSMTIILSSLPANSSLSLKARSQNVSGEFTEWSTPVKVSTYPVPLVLGGRVLSSSSLELSVDVGVNTLPTEYQIVDSRSNTYLSTSGTLTATTSYLSASNTTGNLLLNTLTPNTAYTFIGRTRNSSGVLTGWSSPLTLTTFSNVVSSVVSEVVGGVSVNLRFSPNGNPSSTQYSIQDVLSGKYVDFTTNGLVDTSVWGVYSSYGGSNGIMINNLEVGKEYVFTVKSRNSANVETIGISGNRVTTNWIIVNKSENITTVLVSDPGTDVSIPSGAQSGNQIVRVIEDKYLLADVPVLFNQNRDWSSAVLVSDPANNKSVVKFSEVSGISDKFTLYVVAGDTTIFRICPLAKSIEEVSSTCPESVLYTGSFPQSKQVEGSEVTVSKAQVNGVLYWIADGLVGTGGQGEKPTESIGTHTTSTTWSSIQSAVVTTVENTIAGVFNTLSSTVFKNVKEETLPTIAVTTTAVATASVGVATASAAGGLSQLGYGLSQIFVNILSALGLVKKKKPSGYVYNSITKEPLAQAIVRIFDESNTLVSTEVTDRDGIFWCNIEDGKYILDVRRSGFSFPSSVIVSSEDYPLKNVYRGSLTEIQKDQLQVVVPLDPVDLSKREATVTRVKNILGSLLRVVSLILFLGGLVITTYTYFKQPTTVNLVILLLYIPVSILGIVGFFRGVKRYSRVLDEDGIPVKGVGILLRDTSFDNVVSKRVTDEQGRYYFYVSDSGEYRLEVSDSSYSLVGGDVYISSNGKEIISKNLTVRKI